MYLCLKGIYGKDSEYLNINDKCKDSLIIVLPFAFVQVSCV